MGRLRNAIAAAAVGAALAAQAAPAQAPDSQPAPPAGEPASPGTTDGGAQQAEVTQGTTLQTPDAPVVAEPISPGGSGPAAVPDGGADPPADEPEPALSGPDVSPEDTDGPTSELPPISPNPAVVCGGLSAAPPALQPIYQQASDRYGLGPQGPSILAAINSIETNFGQLNQRPLLRRRGRVDAVHARDLGGLRGRRGRRRRADPYDPDDAIFAAARYLSASGMPADTEGAIFAYNHADWYVADVLARAACYGGINGASASALTPMMPVLDLQARAGLAQGVPGRYLAAFEQAAGRYDLGRRGVWALAAVARLESDFGRGMDRTQMRRTGPLGIDAHQWKRFAVDADGDGKVRRQSPGDSAATLARMIWSRGCAARRRLHRTTTPPGTSRRCSQRRTGSPASALSAPSIGRSPSPRPTATAINWDNVELSNSLQQRDIEPRRRSTRASSA